ncbi:SIS domain-containing protein [Actinomadura sp. DC4]|uniref:D-sedoheptulose-7-phosphate isomerase n=1 Tax=Actinomadura sp. DC4 TaxID=3055069 RepID=UPI0025B0C2D0|nr:SIS domain-containing protein [Actinomadura sp. DC4]MDN3355734.1 SIS domain-containing protein [Actinomadura sp. DC4]
MRRTAEHISEVFARRDVPGRGLADSADTIAEACHAMSERFHRGGRLFTFGNGGAATDAQHIAVEFVHPVIVGKRALPALSLTGDVATLTGVGAATGFAEVFAHQLRHFAEAGDIALGVSPDGRCADVLRGLRTAKDLGLLTVALLGGDGGDIAGVADHELIVPSADPRVVKEVHVTAYHVLWELVHVFLEQPGVLSPEVIR